MPERKLSAHPQAAHCAPAESYASAAPDSVLVDIRGAAALLGLTAWQVRGLISNQELKVVQVGRRFYLRRAALLKWAERAEAGR